MGVEIEVLQPGDGNTYPKKGDMLTMHYTGTLSSDGTQFDSSVAKGRPFQFVIGIGQVIRGWDEGVAQMSLGEKSVLKISSDYGYGPRGCRGSHPAECRSEFRGGTACCRREEGSGIYRRKWWRYPFGWHGR